MNEDNVIPDNTKMESLKNVTMVAYALYAFSYFAGITAIIAIVLNYIKLEEVAGKVKTVPPDHPWVLSARHVGTNMGD